MTLIFLVFLPGNFRDPNGQPLKAEVRKNLVTNARYIRIFLELISFIILFFGAINGGNGGLPVWILGGAILLWFVMVDIFNTIRTFDIQMIFNLKNYVLPILESIILTIIFSLSYNLIYNLIGGLDLIAFSFLGIVFIAGISLAFISSLYLQVKELSQDEESPAKLIEGLEEEIKAREKYIVDTDHEIAKLERMKPEERDTERLTLLFQKKTWATMDIGIKESRIKRIEDNSSRNNMLLWVIRIVPPAISAAGILVINFLSFMLSQFQTS